MRNENNEVRKTAIVAAVRTPVGRIRGVLSEVPAHEMGALVIREAVKRAGIDAHMIDEIIYGNLYAHDISNMGRYASLEAGIPVDVPAMTVDRRCGTSLTAISLADALIRAGDADCILAGGVESDSNRPFVMMQQDRLHTFTAPVFRKESQVAPANIGNPNMGITAENIAERYHITRKECDAFSVESHRKATKAWKKGYCIEQIVPVEIINKKTKEKKIVDTDEVFRPNCTMETLGKLKPAFKADGVTTAGSSSPNSDGASAVILMEASLAKQMELPILGIINGFSSAGVDPHYMGLGPIAATKKLFKKTGLTMDDIDVIEMNEAFAPQSIACSRELAMDAEKLNPNGGAIALGHPLAATGGILVTKMVYELKRRGGGRGLITFCCGGGQGVSMIIETE